VDQQADVAVFSLRHGDLYVDHAPDRMLLALDLVVAADHDYLKVSGDVVTILAANGTWIYQVVGWQDCALVCLRTSENLSTSLPAYTRG
jgi:hypothetical protein